MTPIPSAAQIVTATDQVVVGSPETQDIDTNLDGHPLPADISSIFIGNTAHSADGITIDSGSNFPPGIAFRRYLGNPTDPSPIVAGTQLGYLDFRGYSGTQMWNAASLDVQVDGLLPFQEGAQPPTKMRFAIADGQRTYVPMELRANGRLELGAIVGTQYFGPGLLGDPKLFVNSTENEWSTIFAARPVTGPGYALRLHTEGETASDYIIGGSSGEGTGTFKFSVRGNGDTHVAGNLFVGGVNIGAQVSELDTRTDSIEARFGTAADTSATAIGNGSRATSANSIAIGRGATATGNNAMAVGNGARSNGASAISHGDGTIASGPGAVAFGSGSISSGQSSVAIGQKTAATRDNSLAVGSGSVAVASAASAVGSASVATAANSTAVGSAARATHEGSTALGVAATSTAANQVTLGGSGTSVRLGDIAASTTAQVGPVDAVTVDANGTLGRESVATTAQLETMHSRMIGALAVSDTQFGAIGERVGVLESSVGELFDLASIQRKETRQGIAAVAAMAQPHFPSGAGRTSYSSNVAYYRGEVGFSAGVMHRFEGDVAFSAGVSYGGGKNTAVRAGVAGEF